jgi:uncharacterized membrane-anchored protein YhcB (DUF1043 family)
MNGFLIGLLVGLVIGIAIATIDNGPVKPA